MRNVLAAAPGGAYGWVCSFSGPPRPGAKWGGILYRSDGLLESEVDTWYGQNTYYSVAALKADQHGDFKRRRVNFSRLLVLVVDDADQAGLQGVPSYVLQTSPGKYQIGILLDAADPDCSDERLVSALINRLAAMGLMSADKSGNNIVRYVRLPVGQNQKPRASGAFDHQLERWDPQQRMTLEDAAAVYGVDLDEVKAELERQPERKELAASGDKREKIQDAVQAILEGSSLHDPINFVAATLVGSGTHPGAVVNVLKGMMSASQAPRDARWVQRYNDIPRSVRTAVEKFTPVLPVLEEWEKEPLFRLASELLGNIKPIQWLVKGYIEQDALCMVFGPPASGKSFLAIDIAACVAAGVHWHGCDVKQGAVFYIAGEGLNGVTRRLAAWQAVNQRSLDGVPLHVSTRAVMILDRQAASDLAEEVQAMSDKLGVVPRMVVVDTLARNFGPGDENKQQDASQFIEHLDQFIRRRWKCCVVIVHHTGHDADRARGSSVFKAAMDQEISVKAGVAGLVEVTVTKMKDADIPPPRTLAIEQVGLGRTDEDGEEITGAALTVAGDPLDYKVGTAQKTRKVIKARDVADLLQAGWAGREVAAVQLGVSPRTVNSMVDKMHEKGHVTKTSDGGWKVADVVVDQLSQMGWLLNVDRK